MVNITTNNESLTTIQLKKETREKLQNIGRKYMTYDNVINELIQDNFAWKSMYEISENNLNKILQDIRALAETANATSIINYIKKHYEKKLDKFEEELIEI